MSEVSMQKDNPKDSPGVFARKSSGLVRTVSTFDTFYFCLNFIMLAIGILFVAAWVFYPGASLTLAAILAFAGTVFLGITYALFSAIYPRSGAEYVPLSRALHPIIGFVGNFSNAIWQACYFGVVAVFAAKLAWAPLFQVLGLQLNNSSLVTLGAWFDGPVGWFVTGAVIISVGSIVTYLGAGLFFRVQRWVYSFAVIAWVVLLIVLAMGAAGVLSFQNSFNAVAGTGAYQQLITAAAKDGAELNPAFSLGATSLFLLWPVFAVIMAVTSTSFSGEIKNVTRGQLIAIPLAQLVGIVLIALLGVFGSAALGHQGLLAFGYAGLANPDLLPIHIYPWITTLASIMAGSPFLTIIILGGVLCLFLINGPALCVYSSRCMLAWSIDGLAPKWLGEVSERYHTPKNAILVSAVLGLIFLAIFAFTTWVSVLSIVLPVAIVFFFVAIAAVIFPFNKKDVYDASPARIQVAGIPLMTITGALAAIAMAWIIYAALTDPVYGANTPVSLGVMIGTFVVGILWYLVTVYVRRKQGVVLDARFKEIPIE